MAKVLPFKGTRYNPEKIKDLSKVMAPPYDVISKEEQNQLYKLDPHNIVRILLGKDYPGDNEKENRYTRAAIFLEEWQKQGILKKDDSPSIYINLQEFRLNGRVRKRLGFIALLKLEEFDTKTSTIYPHENTLTAPKEDRAKLIRAIEANLGPIFAIFEDTDKSISRILQNIVKSNPLIDIVDTHGIRNKLCRISDKRIIEGISDLIKGKKIFIADGHHRYEVGLEFSKFKKDPRYRHILTYFTDLFGKDLVILPVHRLVKGLTKEAMPALIDTLKKNFIVRNIRSKKETESFLAATRPCEARFVIYRDKKFTGLILENKKDLDVSIVKNLIIDKLRNISIDFTKDLDYAIKEVDKDSQCLAILVNPVQITEIRDIAFLGNRMPQKSTYFYPKVLTGLVINVF